MTADYGIRLALLVISLLAGPLEGLLELLLKRRQPRMLSLMLIKPLLNGLNPGNDPTPVLISPVHQEPVHLRSDDQAPRAGNAEAPELPAVLLLTPPVLRALRQPGKLLAVLPNDVIHPARVQPSRAGTGTLRATRQPADTPRLAESNR